MFEKEEESAAVAPQGFLGSPRSRDVVSKGPGISLAPIFHVPYRKGGKLVKGLLSKTALKTSARLE